MDRGSGFHQRRHPVHDLGDRQKPTFLDPGHIRPPLVDRISLPFKLVLQKGQKENTGLKHAPFLMYPAYSKIFSGKIIYLTHMVAF